MPCYEVAEDWDEFPDILWEVDGILKKVERRTYEEGPPVLSVEELEASDAKMDEVEIQRLLSMGVLEEMDDGEDASSDVQAWMQEWKLEISTKWMAKGDRGLWLKSLDSPFMENLRNPVDWNSTQRLLAGLRCSDPRLCLSVETSKMLT